MKKAKELTEQFEQAFTRICPPPREGVKEELYKAFVEIDLAIWAHVGTWLPDKLALAAHDQKVRAETLLDASRLISGSCKDDGSETDEALTWAASRIRLLAETGK